MAKGVSITIEGPIRSGKTALVKQLVEGFVKGGYKVIITDKASSSSAVELMKKEYDYIIIERSL